MTVPIEFVTWVSRVIFGVKAWIVEEVGKGGLQLKGGGGGGGRSGRWYTEGPELEGAEVGGILVRFSVMAAVIVVAIAGITDVVTHFNKSIATFFQFISV